MKRKHGVLWWILMIAVVGLIAAFIDSQREPSTSAPSTALATYPIGCASSYLDEAVELVPGVSPEPYQVFTVRGTVLEVLPPEDHAGINAFILKSDWGVVSVFDQYTALIDAGLEDDVSPEPDTSYVIPSAGTEARFVLTYAGTIDEDVPMFMYGANEGIVSNLRAEAEAETETAAETPVPSPTATEPARNKEAETTETVASVKLPATEMPETATPTPAPTKAPKTYICNTSSKVFHRPGCSSVSSMSDSNKKTYEGQASDLIAAGYKACGRCNPY